MSPTANQASGGRGRGGGITLVPLATVLARLDEAFEEPLNRAALLPGFAEYEKALSVDGWPATGNPLVLLKLPDKGAPWGVVDNLFVLAAAKAVGKKEVPCIFVTKEQVNSYRANVAGGLNPPRASTDEDEEMLYRAHWSD